MYLCVLLFVLTNTQIHFLDNIFISATQDIISVTSKGRFGYFYLVINNKTNFENGIALMAVTTDSNLNITYYRGGNETNLSKFIVPSPPEFKKVVDQTGFLFGRFFDDQSFQIELNNPIFQQRFPLPFQIFVGVNKNSKPKSAIDFEEKFDESTWLNFTDYYYRVQTLPSPLIRLETLHPAVFAFVIFYHIVIFILSIIFSRYQPLKSRGILPIIIPIVLIIELSCDSFTFFSIKTHQAYMYFNYFLRFPILLSVISIYFVQYIRFLSLIYLNDRKQFIFFQKEKPTSMKFQYQLIKHFGKFYVLAPLFIIFYIFYIIILGITFAIEIVVKFDLVGLIAVLLILPISFISYVTYFIDIVKNFNQFKTCKAYTDDNLYWRLEFYVLGSFNFLFFLIGLVAVLYFVIFNIQGVYLVFLFALSVFHHELLFTNSVFALIVTIIKVLYSSCKPKKTESHLIETLENDISKDFFIQFAKSEFSIENVLCYYDLKKYQSEPKVEIRALLAVEISDTYLKGSASELEVNVTAISCRKVEHAIQTKNFTKEIFNEIFAQIVSNLTDTYNRFIFSESYQKLKKVKVLLKEVN